jgi:peroxiredoxin
MGPRGAAVLLALSLALSGCALRLRDGAVIPTRSVPRFVLNNQDGHPVALDSALAAGPTVVFFYRGHWCLFCRLQLAELAESRDVFKRRGARVIAISADSRDESIEFARRLEQSGGVSPLWFPLLRDPGADVAAQWGVAVYDEPVAVPSTFVVRGDGSVAWSKVGASAGDRSTIPDVLAVLDSLGSESPAQTRR